MPLDQPPPSSPLGGLFEDDPTRMPFGDHLDELRRRLIWALLGVVAAAIFTFTYGFEIIGWLVAPFLAAQEAAGLSPNLITTDTTLGFSIYLKVSLLAAVVVAAPWVLLQGWWFVVSGLYPKERRTIYVLAPFSTVMTALAIMFFYYVLLPVCLLFFANFATMFPEWEPQRPSGILALMDGVEAPDPPAATQPDSVPTVTVPVLQGDPETPVEGQLWINVNEGRAKIVVNGKIKMFGATQDRILSPLPNIDDYINFATLSALGVTAAFQLPVLMMVIGWTGLIDPAAITPFRRYAMFGCFLAAAVLTPTDIFSMFVLGVPLYLLFEFGLLVMRLADKARRGSSEPV